MPFGIKSYSDLRLAFKAKEKDGSSVPFGIKSYSDNPARLYCVHVPTVISAFRHQVLFGQDAHAKAVENAIQSSVPFGIKSYSDSEPKIQTITRIVWVISAFRHQVLFGLPSVTRKGKNLVTLSSVPFGIKSYSDLMRSYRISYGKTSHQCLSASSPIRTLPKRERFHPLLCVISAFRHQVLFGPLKKSKEFRKLMSSVPFGIKSYSDNPNWKGNQLYDIVISAFRHQVLFGPHGAQRRKSHRYFCHQCLSASSPIRTWGYDCISRKDCGESSVPFGIKSYSDVTLIGKLVS